MQVIQSGRFGVAAPVQVAWGAAGTLNVSYGYVDYPTGITAGMGLFMQVYGEDSSSVSAATPSGWSSAGIVFTLAGLGVMCLYYKAATGSESGALDISAGWTADTSLTGWMMRTSDVVSGFESSTSTALVGTGSTITNNSVTTSVDLGMALMANSYSNTTRTIGASTGESGGNWTEPVTEQIAGDPVRTFQWQTAQLATATTISGGSSTLSGSSGVRVQITVGVKP